MKKITVILSVLMCLLLLSACTGSNEPTTTEATTTEALTTEVTTTESKTTKAATTGITTTQSTTIGVTSTLPEKTEAEKSLSRLKAKMAKSVDYFAVAYAGYYDGGYKEVMTELEKAGIIEKYPFIGEITKKNFYALEGNQVYVVVPADDAEVKLHECGFDENGELILIDELSSCDNGMPFIIKGNISDSRPDFHIEAYIDDELMLSYNPLLSMEDGKLYDVNGILDFTSYDLLPFYG